MRLCVIAISILLFGFGPAAAQGRWFDIGDGSANTIVSLADPNSSIYYPPYPFGPFYPPGTLVYSELFKLAPDQFAAVYVAYFDDGGCGCTGTLSPETITYRFHYDESLVTWPEASTTLYLRAGLDWIVHPGSTVDVGANVVVVGRSLVLNNLRFAVGGPSLVPVEESSWGRIKALYSNP